MLMGRLYYSENNSSLCSWMLINFALDKFILGPNV